MDENGEIVTESSENDIPRNPKTPLEMVSKATQIPPSELRSKFLDYEHKRSVAEEERDIVFDDPDNLLIVGKTTGDSFHPFQRRYLRFNQRNGSFETACDLTIGRHTSEPLNILRPVRIYSSGESGEEYDELTFGDDDRIGAELFLKRGEANITAKFNLAGRLLHLKFYDGGREKALFLDYDSSTGNYINFPENRHIDDFNWSIDPKTGKLTVSNTNEGEVADTLIMPTELDLLLARESMVPDALLKNPTMENMHIDEGWKIPPLVALGGRWEGIGGTDRAVIGE